MNEWKDQLNEWKDQLEAEGFRHYPNGDQFEPLADEFWQRWQRSGDNKLYAINVYVYHEKPIAGGNKLSFGVMFKARMYLGEDQPWFEVTINDAKTVAQAIAFFSDVFVRMGCCADIHNN